MNNWSHVAYRDFWDVPRMVIAKRGEETFLFYSRFDEAADSHTDHYEVWVMPSLTEERLQSSWLGLENMALSRLPNVGIHDLPFVVPLRGQHV